MPEATNLRKSRFHGLVGNFANAAFGSPAGTAAFLLAAILLAALAVAGTNGTPSSALPSKSFTEPDTASDLGDWKTVCTVPDMEPPRNRHSGRDQRRACAGERRGAAMDIAPGRIRRNRQGLSALEALTPQDGGAIALRFFN